MCRKDSVPSLKYECKWCLHLIRFSRLFCHFSSVVALHFPKITNVTVFLFVFRAIVTISIRDNCSYPLIFSLENTHLVWQKLTSHLPAQCFQKNRPVWHHIIDCKGFNEVLESLLCYISHWEGITNQMSVLCNNVMKN